MTQINGIKLESSRLYLQPLSLEQLVLYKNYNLLLESQLELLPIKRIITNEFIVVIETCNIPYVMQHPEKILYGTLWVIIEKKERVIIGDVGFKGAPSEFGLIEVVYTIYESYRRMGYMSEALGLLTKWAFDDPKVTIILAETDKNNIGSQKTLSKCKFTPFAETDTDYWWRLDKNPVN